MAAAKKRSGKKEADLEEMIRSGQSGAYEALQLYRSRALRYKAKNDPTGAAVATAAGAKCLLENNYENAGFELAEVFLDIMTEFKLELTESMKTLFVEIDDRFPRQSAKRVEFLRGAVKFTITCGTRSNGDPQFQTRLAECYWQNGDKHASFHFAAGEAPLLLNKNIFASFPEANQQEKRDQALTVGIVNFLSLENLRDANELHFAYLNESKTRKFDTSSELLKFVDFLLQTCKRDAGPLFKTLVNTYASILDFDEQVPDLLMGPIAQIFFNIKPKSNPMMAMLEHMFK